MRIISFLGLFLLLWYMSAAIQTCVYLYKNFGHTYLFDFHDLIYAIVIPFELFCIYFMVLRIAVFRKRKKRKRALKFMLLYFINYKISVIFLTELIKEEIDIMETSGQLAQYSKSRKKEKNTPNLSVIQKDFKLQEKIGYFEKLLADA